MKYEVLGNINIKGELRKFCIDIDAASEKHARDKVAAFFGSKYGVKRNAVKITEVKKGA
ncbi:MAG: 50S ribosomal protein L18Ae [Candidatus Micrarchaeia archaeon]